jgi:hypothetical protein
MTDVTVISIPVTSSIKIDVRALGIPISYSDVMPSITQMQVETRIELQVPDGYEPGGELDEGQKRLAEVIAYVTDAVDAANVGRLANMKKRLEAGLYITELDDL